MPIREDIPSILPEIFNSVFSPQKLYNQPTNLQEVCSPATKIKKKKKKAGECLPMPPREMSPLPLVLSANDTTHGRTAPSEFTLVHPTDGGIPMVGAETDIKNLNLLFIPPHPNIL